MRCFNEAAAIRCGSRWFAWQAAMRYRDASMRPQRFAADHQRRIHRPNGCASFNEAAAIRCGSLANLIVQVIEVQRLQ